MTPEAAAELTRRRLILSAKAIILDHWPAPDQCPVCKVPGTCIAAATALAYLELVDEPLFVPPSC